MGCKKGGSLRKHAYAPTATEPPQCRVGDFRRRHGQAKGDSQAHEGQASAPKLPLAPDAIPSGGVVGVQRILAIRAGDTAV